MLDIIKDIILSYTDLNYYEITEDSRFRYDLDITDGDMNRIWGDIESEFDISISNYDFNNLETVQELIDLIENLGGIA